MNEDLIIADCETDNLLDAMTTLHCLQIGTPDGDDCVVYSDKGFADRPLAEGVARMASAKKVVFHNAWGFDFWAINRMLPGTLRVDQVIDSLVLSRMTNIAEKQHGLEAWGRRTGTMKGNFKGPYDVWTQEFADYSRQDIPAGRAVWHRVKHGLEWTDGRVYEIEARAAYCIARQEQNGFMLDVKAAQELHATLSGELSELRVKLHEIFPAFSREEVFIPKVNAPKYGYQKGVPFIKKWEDEFNPRSRQMIAEGLQRDGWVPLEHTPTGQPKVDEETLLACDHPGAKLLVTYLKTSKVLGSILGEKAGKGYLQLVRPNGRVHGRVNTLGATTWRMSHANPNLANVDKDPRVRSLWVPRKGWKLVGCDAAEIQARGLAHYLHPYDGGLYQERLLKGSKADKTDGHSLNLVALQPYGLVTRDGAKTALYARLFGARAPRMWATINEDRVKHDLKAHPKSAMQRVGQGAIDALGRSMVGLNDLIEDVQSTGKSRGYLIGVSGAQIPVAAAHAALVGLLQNLEATVMKMALGDLEFDVAPRVGWVHGVDYGYVANVHDEVQIEARPEIAEDIGKTFAACIVGAGLKLKIRCPLAGDYKVGDNWQETH